jgi:ATP-dependent Clp protease ATP-binding subunit ClpC
MNLSKFIGATPGYIGYNDEGVSFAEKVLKARKEAEEKGTPLPIIILDEIEKAHPKAYTLLMQILEEGTLESGKGVLVNFKGMDVYMTSNIAQRQINEARAAGITGDEDLKEIVNGELKKVFPPEFINRIGDIVIFKNLERGHIAKILDLYYQDLSKSTQEQDGYSLTVTDDLKEHILNEGYSAEFGARKAREVADQILHTALMEKRIELILNDELAKSGKMTADWKAVETTNGQKEWQVIFDYTADPESTPSAQPPEPKVETIPTMQPPPNPYTPPKNIQMME